MHKSILFLFCIALPACSHHAERQQVEQTLVDLRCEEALQKPSDATEEIKNSSRQIGKNLLAYTYIAGNYTTEVLWDTTAGVVLFVTLCGPAIAVASASYSYTAPPLYLGDRYQTSLVCIPFPGQSKKGPAPLFSPPLGRKARKDTKAFRCPDTKPVLAGIEKLVRCYQNRDDKESLQKALQTLENLEMSESFYDCLPPEEQLALQSTRSELQKRSAEIK
jgi:hypothetical protein